METSTDSPSATEPSGAASEQSKSSMDLPQSASNTLRSLEGLSFSDSNPWASEPLPDDAASHPQPLPPAPPPKDEAATSATSPSLVITTPKRSPSPRVSPGKAATSSAQEEWDEKEALKNERETEVNDGEFDEKAGPGEENSEVSKTEISSIIGQFEANKVPDIVSPAREHPVFQYPPRNSSLENLRQYDTETTDHGSPVISPTYSANDADRASVSYAGSIKSQPPPEPDPEPDLPFDFHRFLEQLRHRTADPVARFLRSFLQEFGKKQWQVHEQTKIISDFLNFITTRMAQCDIWKNVSDAEFDNAKEGMEKLVMNRLYTQTFSPEIPPGEASPVKGRRRGTNTPLGPGRKGQHQEDVERDDVLAQKMRIYGWIREQHLDIKAFNDKGSRFLKLAQQELIKIKSYRAPRDKVICVLNCCKVIFGYLRNAESDLSADDFIPLLIYTVLKAKPDHLVSNVQYILRFRNPDKLGGEAGYYISSLLGAVQFIENLDRTNLTVSDSEFDTNVEAAVSEITARNEREEKSRQQPTLFPPPSSSSSSLQPAPAPFSRRISQPTITVGDATYSSAEATAPRNSAQAERGSEKSSEHSGDEKAAVSGLLRTIQRPLSTIGRILSSEGTSPSSTSLLTASSVAPDRPPLTPQPSTRAPQAASNNTGPGAATAVERQSLRLAHEDAAAMQASAETAEAQRIMVAEHRTVVETLSGMFPDLDKEIIGDVVRMKEGRIGQAVDACLALSR